MASPLSGSTPWGLKICSWAFWKLLKGTRIRRQADQFGYLFRDYAPYQVIASRWLSPLQLERLSMIETVLELYHNKGGFSRTLEFLTGGGLRRQDL